MTKSDLIWAIREIDEDLIQEAEGDAPIATLHARPLRLVLIAAAIVLLLSGTVFAVYVGTHWSELMETYFHMDDTDKDLMDSYVQPVYATVEQDGCTFSITQVMGDEHCMIAALEIQLPDDLPKNAVSTEALRSVAEENGHTWEDLQNRLELLYGYEEADESIPAPVLAYTSFAPVSIHKEELLTAVEKRVEGLSNIELSQNYAWSIDDVVTSAYFAEIATDSSTLFGQDTILRDYNEETNTLTYLVTAHADITLLNRPCTLVISDLIVEDLLATLSQPESDEGVEIICESILTEPVVLNFDATYEPEGQDYEIYQDDTLIGTMELSPFSANVFFPQEPDDPNRLAPNWTDYLENTDIEVTLTDGSAITYHLRSNGISERQFGFFFTNEIVDLSKIERITLHDYTFKPVQ